MHDFPMPLLIFVLLVAKILSLVLRTCESATRQTADPESPTTPMGSFNELAQPMSFKGVALSSSSFARSCSSSVTVKI